jgi:protein translocase SecG subunit
VITAIEIIATILLLIISAALIAIIMMQESNQSGIGALGGSSGADAITERKAPRSKHEKLAFYTKVGGIAIIVLSLGMMFLQRFAE